MSVSAPRWRRLAERARELQDSCIALAVDLRAVGPGCGEETERDAQRLHELSALADAAALTLGVLGDDLSSR
jgi:hypothetical protein